MLYYTSLKFNSSAVMMAQEDKHHHCHLVVCCSCCCAVAVWVHPAAVWVHPACSALHFAAAIGNVKCVKLLADAGADINLQDREGECMIMQS